MWQRFKILFGCCLLCVSIMGCRLPHPRTVSARLPEACTVEADQLKIVSDVKLAEDHHLVLDLKALREDVLSELELEASEREVVVYLFKTPEAYQRYLESLFPGLPPRRAYFVGTSSKLAVYTFWSDRVLEDLRHEYTHGLLHACLGNVPLWVDEGLAEYFEHDLADYHRFREDYAQSLQVAFAKGWTPNLARLETLDHVAEMHLVDYQEAWLWVHFLLNDSPESRQILLQWLKSEAETVGGSRESLARTIQEHQLPIQGASIVQRFQDHLRDTSGKVHLVSFDKQNR